MKRKIYEDSPADKRADAADARKAGISAKQFENSAADRRMDKAGQSKMDKSAKKR